MHYSFVETIYFTKQIKKLSSKFPKIINDWQNFKNKFVGNFEVNLGSNIYKVRIRNSSIPTGKSGGFRVIVIYKSCNGIVYPLLIFSKTQYNNVTKNDIKEALKNVIEELKK